MEEKTKFVDIIIPVAIPNLFTYRVPREMREEVEPGKRVVVQFGKSKLYSGIIRFVHYKAPEAYTAKYIEAVLDTRPVVNQLQFNFWDWISSYYMCTHGEVMSAALPGAMKLESETKLVLNPDFDGDLSVLNDKEYLVAEAVQVQEVISPGDAAKVLDQKTVYPVIRALLEKKVILTEQELKSRYKPKMVAYVKLTSHAEKEANLKKIFDELESAPKQLNLLMVYLQVSNLYSAVKKLDLQKRAGANSALIKELVKKNVFEVFEQEESRLGQVGEEENDSKSLSLDQQVALEEIHSIFKKEDVGLLYGVTSSGKTEIYVKLMEEVLKEGKQVLYLLPEIALTTQLINRLRKYFDNRIAVYHSRFNQHERVEVWNKVLNRDGCDIILGPRSALFLPFEELGLIIVDEEHENSFKQFDPAPRYHARDAAIVLAKLHGAKTLLGSATPSIESFHNAQKGKYGLIELKKRYGGIQLPEIFVADVKEAVRKKKMKSHFAPLLMQLMEETFESNEQVILFQNRRGFSPFVQCETCGSAPMCTKCDVSLTYHKKINRLKCHYCGYNTSSPKQCAGCGSTDLKLKGFGTEKIEEELALFFPDLRIKRMDLDTTRSKNSYQRIINEFENGQIDVLVGTQMVTKGLDFDNVGLVGILNADNMLYFPDFRAFERSYQLMSQVAGRAGRKKKRGKVVIQTYNPYHTVVEYVVKNDYASLYESQLLERRNFQYPPFFRLIKLTVKHQDIALVNEAADFLAAGLKKKFGKRVLGPEFPSVIRVRNLYLKNIMLKIEKEASLKEAKRILEKILIDFQASGEYKKVRVIVDVDPM